MIGAYPPGGITCWICMTPTLRVWSREGLNRMGNVRAKRNQGEWRMWGRWATALDPDQHPRAIAVLYGYAAMMDRREKQKSRKGK